MTCKCTYDTTCMHILHFVSISLLKYAGVHTYVDKYKSHVNLQLIITHVKMYEVEIRQHIIYFKSDREIERERERN